MATPSSPSLSHRWLLVQSVLLGLSLLFLLFQSRLPAYGLLSADAFLTYVLQLLMVVLTAGVVFGSLRLFRFRMVARKLEVADEPLAWSRYLNCCKARSVALGVVLLFNLSVSHLLSDFSAVCCALIVGVASYFCIPSHSEFASLRCSLTSAVQ